MRNEKRIAGKRSVSRATNQPQKKTPRPTVTVRRFKDGSAIYTGPGWKTVTGRNNDGLDFLNPSQAERIFYGLNGSALSALPFQP
jgi:hypothetical protein